MVVFLRTDSATLGHYLFAPGKRHAEKRNAGSLSKEIAAECGGERGEALQCSGESKAGSLLLNESSNAIDHPRTRKGA